MSGNVAIFVGPSLPEVTPEHNEIIFPPAAKGDLKRLSKHEFSCVLLIDGVFDIQPSVQHSEIYHLLASGVQVIGASSIGALRAAEMRTIGMIGVGEVFLQYASATIAGDDEVALLHGPLQLNYQTITIPLINLRVTADHLSDCYPGLQIKLSNFIAAAERISFRDRTWEHLDQVARHSDSISTEKENISELVRKHYIDQKRVDAVESLHIVRGKKPRPTRQSPHYSIPPSFHEITSLTVSWLADFIGVSRIANITRLDRINIPVCCAIRPAALANPIAAGKGLDISQSIVSAVMEATEFFLLEQNILGHAYGTAIELGDKDSEILTPLAFGPSMEVPHWSEGLSLAWLKGKNLLNNTDTYVPRGLVSLKDGSPLRATTNGMAVHFSNVSATLHAVYELLERDAVARLVSDSNLMISETNCRIIDCNRILDESICHIIDRIHSSGMEVVVIWIRSRIPMHTFLVALLGQRRDAAFARVTVGYGASLSPVLGLQSALLEAIQVRLSYIHGARPGLHDEGFNVQEGLWNFFRSLRTNEDWKVLRDYSTHNDGGDLEVVLSGASPVWRL